MTQFADPIYEAQAFEIAKMASHIERLVNENDRLRALCKSMRCALVGHDDKVYLNALDQTLIDEGFDLKFLPQLRQARGGD